MPFHCTQFEQSPLSVKITTVWDVLPDDMKSCTSISMFRTELKGLLNTAQLCNHILSHGILTIMNELDFDS